MADRFYTGKTPDKPAYIMGATGEVVTHRQLEELANQGAHLFRDLGLKSGDAIAIFMENNAHYMAIASAAARSGLLYTTISTHLAMPEIEYIVADSGAQAFITSKAKAELAAGLIEKMPGVKTRLMVNGTIEGFESYEEKIKAYPVDPIPDEKAGQDLLYSSGTTGRPKGVFRPVDDLDYGELAPGADLLIALYGLDEGTVYISPAPLYHAAPLRFVTLTLAKEGTAIIMERFDPEQALALIEKYKATHSQWVPTMFIRMMKLPEEIRNKYDTSSLRIAIHAAAPCPVEVKAQMIDWWGPILFEYYAGTEGNGLTAINSEEWLTHKGSVGRAMMGVVKIMDDDDNELPVGQIGTVYFADGQPFEYHNDPEKTADSFNKNGWSTLSDVGYLDEEGYLFLTDRKLYMIISGGVNIYPQETENILVMHPKVQDVAVIGVPNEDFGEEVKAVVQLMDMTLAGPELEQELIEYCRANLSKMKCPVSIDFESELPRTPTGKLIKRHLRDRYWKKKA